MPLALMVQPLALPHPSEEPIQVMHLSSLGHLKHLVANAIVLGILTEESKNGFSHFLA